MTYSLLRSFLDEGFEWPCSPWRCLLWCVRDRLGVVPQDQKENVEDGPLAACVASGWVTFVRKVANEQGMLEAAEGAGASGACMPSAGSADSDEDLAPCAGVVLAGEPDGADETFQDGVDCLEVDAD